MNIIFASHSPFDQFLVVGSHHLARKLAKAGHTVWHIGPPITPVHVLKARQRTYRNRLFKALSAPQEIQPNLVSMEPLSLVPWQLARKGLSFGNLFILSSNIDRTLGQKFPAGSVDVLLIDEPRFAGLEKLLQPKATFYRPTDLYASMKNDPLLLVAERQLLANCRGVIATSKPVLQHALSLKAGLPHLLLENGVDFDHFSRPMAEPEELRVIPHPRVVYMGAVDFRFDCEALAFMAAALPEAHFVILGPGSRLGEIRMLNRPNIHLLGPKPYAAIPGFLQHAEVGILPLSNAASNSGRSPMKLYEYGAAGLPVVARKTPELDRRPEAFIHLYDNNREAVECLQAALSQPTDRKAHAESCRTHAWTAKAATLLEFIHSATLPPEQKPGFVPFTFAKTAPIYFNARFLDQEMTGVQRYAHGMLAALESQLTVVRPASPLSPVRGHLWEQVILPAKCGDALLWSPGNTGPMTKQNQVVTVHDASTLDHPEWFSGRFAVWYRFLLPRLIHNARKIITVSEFSRERLLAKCEVPASRIAVVYNAVDTRFQPASACAIDEFRQRHQLSRPFCLYVGSLEPRKNLPLLLQAWRQLARPDHELVLAGAAGHVFREKGLAELPPNTRLLGRVPDSDLPTLLSAASCFVFPSLYEGFGYPPLEAMACGCPVICSNATSLPEVCGPGFDEKDSAAKGAVVYFDPADAEQLAAQLRYVLALPPETLERLQINGKNRAALFNWGRCISQTWAVLEELARA